MGCTICRGPAILDAIRRGDTQSLQDCISADPSCVDQRPLGCCCCYVSSCCGCWHHPAAPSSPPCECCCYSNVYADTPLLVAIRYFLLHTNRPMYGNIIQILLNAKADVNGSIVARGRPNQYCFFPPDLLLHWLPSFEWPAFYGSPSPRLIHFFPRQGRLHGNSPVVSRP